MCGRYSLATDIEELANLPFDEEPSSFRGLAVPILLKIVGAIMLLGVGWVASLLRVGPRLIVTGAGAFLTILGGFFLVATARPLLAEFRRKKVYDDDVGSVAGEALASVQ